MKKIFAPLLIAMLFAGCSTGYHEQDIFGGYQDMRLDDSVYSVEYSSNYFTTESENYEHAIHRSAELTKLKGYNYFEIKQLMDNSTTSTSISFAESSKPYRHLHYSRSGHDYRYDYGYEYEYAPSIIPQTHRMQCPGLRITIKMFDSATENSLHADTILNKFSTENP